MTDYKALRIRFNKIDKFIRLVYDGTRYLTLPEVENMIPFKTGLDILKV